MKKWLILALLAPALATAQKYEASDGKTRVALGIASTPWGDRDAGGLSRQAAYNLIKGAIQGIKER